MGTSRLHKWESERKNGRRVEVNLIKEGGQDDDWISVMTSVLSLTVWESRSDIENRLAAEHL